MFNKIKEVRDQIKTLKELQSKMSGVDLSNPQAMLESMGIDADDIEKHFTEKIMETQEQKVPLLYVNQSDNEDPNYVYISDSGFDLRTTEDVWVQAHDRKLISTGLRFDIPLGYEIQVRSKSGLALNQGLMVLNSPGTVDSGYQGEVKVILFNTTKDRIKIEKGQKIAQAVLCPVVNGKWVNLVKVDKIQEKDRNDKGFGSTGL
jgi:dUTP pyrophosphatase